MVDWPMRYLILIALALIVASGISIYIINRNSPVAQAQVDPSQLYISPNAPAIKGGWQENLYHGQTHKVDTLSEDYDLWEYREDRFVSGTGHDGTPHTYKQYYQYIYDGSTTTTTTNPGPPPTTTTTTTLWSQVRNRNQNQSPPVNNLGPNDPITDQTPYLVLGDDHGWERDNYAGSGTSHLTNPFKDIHGKSTDFYDPVLELDLWIPQSNSIDIGNLKIKAIDLCNHPSDHTDVKNTGDLYPYPMTANTYVHVYIEGKKGEQSTPIINGETQCTGRNYAHNTVYSAGSPNPNVIGDPLETGRTFYLGSPPQGIKYERYRIIARINQDALYINQFKLEVTGVGDSFLVVPKTDGNADNDIKDKHTLNLSNRILDPGYSDYKTMWEVELYVAPDAKYGCSYETESYIGIFDSDWQTSVVSWMRLNNYNPKVAIYSADRNDFLDGRAIFPQDPDEILDFNGSFESVDERKPVGLVGVDVSQNEWEDKIYDFRGDQIYKLHFYNIAQGTWIQLRIPFDQINALEKCIRKPLVKVYYSDISAGGRFGLGDHLDACVRDNDLNKGIGIDASVYTHGTGEINQKAFGSSTQYGARVHDEILGFYSNFPPSGGKGPPKTSVKELTFANTLAVWGGQFGGRGRCMPNYWRGANRLVAENISTLDIGDNTDPLKIENNTEKLYEMNPPGLFQLTNSRPTEDLKLKVSVYVDGDLSIKTNILNTRGELEKFNEIGYIYLIAKGDIFIDPSVTQIDAILVAYTDDPNPNPNVGGRIFTCNSGTNPNIHLNDISDQQAINDSTAYDNACNQKLTINGALIGREIHLGRTFCEVVSPTCAIPDPDQVGEEINLSPEYFVGIPQLPEFSEWLYNSDSVTILPANF